MMFYQNAFGFSWIELSNSAENKGAKVKNEGSATIQIIPQNIKIKVIRSLIHEDWNWLVPHEAE